MSNKQYQMCVLLLLHNAVFAENLPKWVSTPTLEGGYAYTYCDDRDTSEETLVTNAFTQISFAIESSVETTTTGYPRKTDTQVSKENSLTEENERFSTEYSKHVTKTSIGPYVSVRAMDKLMKQNLSKGDTDTSTSDFQSASITLFTNPARSESREVWIHSKLSAKEKSTETKIKDDTLAWHEVISMLLFSGQYTIYTDYVQLHDHEMRCSFVGYLVNVPSKN